MLARHRGRLPGLQPFALGGMAAALGGHAPVGRRAVGRYSRDGESPPLVVVQDDAALEQRQTQQGQPQIGPVRSRQPFELASQLKADVPNPTRRKGPGARAGAGPAALSLAPQHPGTGVFRRHAARRRSAGPAAGRTARAPLPGGCKGDCSEHPRSSACRWRCCPTTPARRHRPVCRRRTPSPLARRSRGPSSRVQVGSPNARAIPDHLVCGSVPAATGGTYCTTCGSTRPTWFGRLPC